MTGSTGSFGTNFSPLNSPPFIFLFIFFLFHYATVAGKGLSLRIEEGDFSLRATLGGSKGSG